MTKIYPKKLETLTLSGVLLIGIALLGGCTKEKTVVQIIKDVSVEKAYDLIRKNKDNENFIIIDVRTPGEFAN